MFPRPLKPQAWAQRCCMQCCPLCVLAGEQTVELVPAGPQVAEVAQCQLGVHTVVTCSMALRGPKFMPQGSTLRVWMLGSLDVVDSANVSWRVTKVSWVRGSLGRKLMGSQTLLLSTGKSVICVKVRKCALCVSPGRVQMCVCHWDECTHVCVSLG